MKKYFTLLALCICVFAKTQATDLFVDQSIAPGSLPNYYNTIIAAIVDSNNGDKIFVKEGVYTGNLNIDKSLSIIPLVEGTKITIFGTISILGFPSFKTTLIGVNSVSNLYCLIGTQTSTNKATVSIIDSKIDGIYVDADNYDLKCINAK
ncbi:MAG: hypothetical protein IPI46_04245 [Bacteroidetes bacterium]|nr:hypothetical protein [Bacteroidota bacterium]